MSDRELLESLASEVRGMRVELMTLRNIVEKKASEENWKTLKEACSYLHIGKTTMQQRLTNGEVPWAVKHGKKWLFPADKLKLYAGNRI